jgi:heme O synthase-like polyprenyltransferase
MAGIPMLEYVYTKRQHKRSMTILLSLWALVFVTRVALFTLYGWEYIYSATNLTLVFVSGSLVGLIIRALIIRKRSVEIDAEALGLSPVE